MSIRKIKRRHMESMSGPIEKLTFTGESWAFLRALPNDAARHDAIRKALSQHLKRSRHG